MRAATEGHLPPVMPQGNLAEVLGREVRKGSPGELMVESSPSRQRRPPCKTSKEMSDEPADAAALTSYLLTYTLPDPEIPLVYSVHYGQQCTPEWDDGSVPAETADRQKKKSMVRATSMLRRISCRRSRV